LIGDQPGNLSINLPGNTADNEIWGSGGAGVITGGADDAVNCPPRAGVPGHWHV
jgi:hypothetical protein